MSRSLVLITMGLVLLSLAACSAGPELPQEAQAKRELLDYNQLQHWLSLQQEVDSMSTEQAILELGRSSIPERPDEVFYHALLNQRLDAYGNWTLARDGFRGLRSAPGLTDQQRQLASILERYNQSRINWYRKREQLQDDNQLLRDENQGLRGNLAAAEAEKLLLEEKIQAITDLETAISTRKE